MTNLADFIVRAKSATYVSDGSPSPSTRPASRDIVYREGPWRYLDSYFGGSDFAGQEVIWHDDTAVWAMNYFGRILRDDLISAVEAGRLIKAALSSLYREGRFLGGYSFTQDELHYADHSDGDHRAFFGFEEIHRNGLRVYELRYCGGLIRP